MKCDWKPVTTETIFSWLRGKVNVLKLLMKTLM
jgi:hypothetical protein